MKFAKALFFLLAGSATTSAFAPAGKSCVCFVEDVVFCEDLEKGFFSDFAI